MSKRTVSRLFIGSLIAGLAGAILAIAAGGMAYANDVFVMSGNQITGVQWTALAWSMLGLGIVGSLALVAAAIGGLVAYAAYLGHRFHQPFAFEKAEGAPGWAQNPGPRVWFKEAFWHRLVHERGWTSEQFAAWLGRVWVAALVSS